MGVLDIIITSTITITGTAFIIPTILILLLLIRKQILQDILPSGILTWVVIPTGIIITTEPRSGLTTMDIRPPPTGSIPITTAESMGEDHQGITLMEARWIAEEETVIPMTGQ